VSHQEEVDSFQCQEDRRAASDRSQDGHKELNEKKGPSLLTIKKHLAANYKVKADGTPHRRRSSQSLENSRPMNPAAKKDTKPAAVKSKSKKTTASKRSKKKILHFPYLKQSFSFFFF